VWKRFFQQTKTAGVIVGMPGKYECLIEVRILYPSKHLQEMVTSKMVKSIAKLRAVVEEEMGGNIRVRY